MSSWNSSRVSNLHVVNTPIVFNQIPPYDPRILTTNSIPRILWQTWHTTLPPKMATCIQHLKSEHPTFKHYIYNISGCRQSIQTYLPEALEAYDTLIPYAYKSDLWRLCILYIYGGIYLDTKLKCIKPFNLSKLITSSSSIVVSRHRSDTTLPNAILACKPRNPLLLQAITMIIENVKSRIYGSTPYDVTGPGLLSTIFTIPSLVSNTFEYNNQVFFYEGRRAIDYYQDYYKEVSTSQEYYVDSWKNKTIYLRKALMFVADPHDEVLYGYTSLIPGTTIVCFTNKTDPVRSKEFNTCMARAGTTGILLDYNSSMTDDKFLDGLLPLIDLDNVSYECIISYSAAGNDGHVQHIRVHQIAKYIAEMLGIPFQEFSPCSTNSRFRDHLLSIYASQALVAKSLPALDLEE